MTTGILQLISLEILYFTDMMMMSTIVYTEPQVLKYTIWNTKAKDGYSL